MKPAATLVLWILCGPVWTQPVCHCDPKDPETLKERSCALCAAAERATTPAFFAQDTSPRKPNRWLAMPREHAPGIQHLADLSPAMRAELWREAIGKAKSLWGERWGIATNGDIARTQCHLHIHIGRLIDGVEAGDFMVANGPEEIPLPAMITDGLWIHPVDGKLHVHIGEQLCENVLLR